MSGNGYDPEAYVEAVLSLVEQIPAGRVMSYGAIAEYLHARFGRGSARRVGTIMALHGAPVPWHRVPTGDGRLPPGHEREARRRLEAEGVAFRGQRVLMADHAWWPTDPATDPAPAPARAERAPGVQQRAPTPPRRKSPAAPLRPTALTPPK